MRSITLRNFRCFGDEPQTARLAPLTLLVGENSSGKTSLMAMVRALWDVAYLNRVPDFKEEPYDLGSFDEIVHHRGARGGRAQSFEAGFDVTPSSRPRNGASSPRLRFDATFTSQWSAPTVASRSLEFGEYRFIHQLHDGKFDQVEMTTPRGRWRLRGPTSRSPVRTPALSETLSPIDILLIRLDIALGKSNLDFAKSESWEIESLDGAPAPTDEDISEVLRAVSLRVASRGRKRNAHVARPYASAPVRSQPKRTYDPVRVSADAFGVSVPSYLAELSQREPSSWNALKERLEYFGSAAGLFDEIRVRRRGTSDVDPFHVQVRKFGQGSKGPFRNLVDVGYGVSQVLPVATELLRDGGPSTLLLQQPEVHLHPSAQAALGSLLCQTVAARGSREPRQLIVETHSDFIIDRVRMAVADESQALRPEDVSIVYFERRGLDVCLHSISVDGFGNIVDAPDGYRQFFLEELRRSVSF